MPWPLSQDYNEAIQSPAQCFADPELRQGEAVTNELGLPAPRSGNFADVYAVVTGQRKWAVKCFTRQIPGLQERYQQISLHLEQVKLPFMVDFTFLEHGIRVRGDWYPILKMQWVEGLTLNQFVKSNLDKPHLLDVLCKLWVKLATCLREANIAHCDLQHGNVLLVAGERAGKLSVKLVDYDGMCVPALTLLKSIEVGHPAYQHPQRQREGIYSLEVDRFSHLVIYTALRALMAGGKPLWDKHDDGDNLLFKPSDYAAPTKSRLFYEMLKSPSAEVSNLVDVMMQASSGPLEQTPLLEQVAGGLLIAELQRAGLLEQTPLLEQGTAAAPREAPASTGVRKPDQPRLGILAERTDPPVPDAIAGRAVDADTMGEFDDLVVQVKRKTNVKHTPSPEGKRTKWAMAIGIGVVGLLLAALGALWAGGVFRGQTKGEGGRQVIRPERNPRPRPSPPPQTPDPERDAAEWVLSRGGKVRIRVAGEEKKIDKIDDLPRQPYGLERIDLYDKPLTDAELAHLKGLSYLKSLDLHNTGVSGEGLVHVEGLTKLERLLLWHNPKIGEKGLFHIRNLTKLTDLDLNGTGLNDAALEHLKGLTSLRYLHVGNNAMVTDAGLTHVEGLTNLDNLVLGGTHVTDSGMTHLKNLKKLKWLDLWRTKVTDAGLEQLRGLVNLEGLLLGNTAISNAGLRSLQASPKLRHLDLNGTQVSDLSPLSKLQLTHLNILNITVPDLLPLKQSPLRELNCDFRPERDTDVVRSIKTLEKINGKTAAEFWKELTPRNIDGQGKTGTAETGFVPLFNGKDLTNWKKHPDQPGNWRVENAVLTGSGPAEFSHLFSERGDYANFHLSVEARVSPGGNSGVFFRAPFGLGKPGKFLDLRTLSGYEAEILDVRPGTWTGSLLRWPDRLSVSTPKAPVAPNEWFNMDVTAQANHIVIRVNGRVTADYRDPKRTFARGHIALQQLGGQTVVGFRKIEIKEFPLRSQP